MERSMAMVRVLTVVLVVAISVGALSPATVGAKCAGNMIEPDVGSVGRDGTIHVVGIGWGDDCYDTGEIPPGESVLGRPATGVEVLLVQDGVEHLVATGDADELYGFTADVPVPDELKPGPVEVITRAGSSDGYVVTPEPLIVSDASPTGTSDDAAVRLGTYPPGTVALPITPPRNFGPLLVMAGVVVLAGVLVAGKVYLARRGRRV